MSSAEHLDRQQAERHEQLLHEEARLVRALVDVRTEINSLLPISQLPPDILEQIFYYCIHHPLVQRLSDEPLPKHLIACTQVCRSWRHLSIQCTALWRVIDTCALPFEILRLFLKRSQQSPIAVQSMCSGTSGETNHMSKFTKLCLETLRPHMHRIHSISLHESSHIHGLVPGYFDRYEKSLHHLSLYNVSIHGDFQLLRGNLDISRFHSLSLDGVVLPWDVIGVRQRPLELRYLSLRNMVSTMAPTLQHVLAMLSSSPQLETLTLERIKFRADGIRQPSPGYSEPVNLPKLKDLKLSFSRPETVVQLLHLLLPIGGNSAMVGPDSASSSLFNLQVVGLPSQNIYTLPSITSLIRRGAYSSLSLRKRGFQLSSDDERSLLSLFTAQSPRELTTTPHVISGRVQSTHLDTMITAGVAKPILSRLTELEIGRDVLSASEARNSPTGVGSMWSTLVAQSMTGEPRAFMYPQATPTPNLPLLPCPIYSPILQPFLSECVNVNSIIIDHNYITDLLELLAPTFNLPGEVKRYNCPRLTSITFGGKRLWSGFAEFWLPQVRLSLRIRQAAARDNALGSLLPESMPLLIRNVSFKRCQGITYEVGKKLQEEIGVEVDVTS